MLRRVVPRAARLGGALTLLCAAVAIAAGRETVTETEHVHGEVVFSEAVTNPCNGESGTLTVIGNSIFHVTFFANGDESWATGTITGQATNAAVVTATADNPGHA